MASSSSEPPRNALVYFSTTSTTGLALTSAPRILRRPDRREGNSSAQEHLRHVHARPRLRTTRFFPGPDDDNDDARRASMSDDNP
ncbi:uncharacterized protein HRG_01642 [Hirsutella rhossiliensis]|uniref:Uncharacterized protein n=1 Tax=Hirsutella rhossiliensis TaxID=111463 RepID=A0A9P8N142_9HYPO|nr:uncharacterized protein HRG_01642 [Hirsutella rhossiliensis]KAH0966233.1 hypothetical protein HRG_01642 [Hirsutella rhossiliensis]